MYRPTYHEPHDDLDWVTPAATTIDDAQEPVIESAPVEDWQPGEPVTTQSFMVNMPVINPAHMGVITSLPVEPPISRAARISNERLIEDYMVPDSREGTPVRDTYAESMAAVTVAADAMTAAVISAIREGMASEPKPIVYDALQLKAITDCQDHLFTNISGTAGVGKTFVAKEIMRRIPGTVLAATTGIASVNLGEGTTINALLHYFNTAMLATQYQEGQLVRVISHLRRAGIRRILIDEKSMMAGQQLTYITRAVRESNEGGVYALEEVGTGEDATAGETRAGRPEPAPMGITLVGDFGQLPPVPDSVETKNPSTGERTWKKQPVQFAFDSPEWELYAAHTTTLTTIYRQEAQDFIAALHAIRAGRVVDALRFFTPDRFVTTQDDTFEGSTILPKNDQVDRYNQLRLDQLPGAKLIARSIRNGEQRPDWKNIPETLVLKEGALVMLLANRRIYDDGGKPTLVYANGDLATLRAKNEEGTWLATLMRNRQTVQVYPVIRENTIPLVTGRKKQIKLAIKAALHAEGYTCTQALNEDDYDADTSYARVIRPKDLWADEPMDDEGMQAARAKAEFDRRCAQQITDQGKGKFEIIGTITYMPLRAAYGCTVHKCLLAGTRVAVVGRGLIPVESVQVGDFVFTGQGHTHRVIAAQPTGTKELVTVKFASGRFLHMSPDHPLMEPDGNFIHYAQVGQQVAIGQDVETPARDWAVSLPALVQTPRGKQAYAPDLMTLPLAWWLGALIGDGSMRDQRDGTLEFHARAHAVVEHYCASVKVLFGLTVRRYPNRVYVISRALRAWLYELGLRYTTSEDKSIPEAIFRSTVDVRAAFIRGLFDTDGCVDSRGLRYVTTSKGLVEGVQQLLDSIGIHDTRVFSQIPTFKYRGRKRQGQRAYTLHIRRKDMRRFADRVGFVHPERREKLERFAAKPVRELPSNKHGGTIDRIVEIVRTGLHVPLHNLEVEGDHSFIANGLVVSNTQGLTLDRVQVNIRDPFMRQPGMLFVALSRARTAEGLQIVGDQSTFVQCCKIEPRVQQWL